TRIAIAAGREHDRVAEMRGDLAGDHITGDNPACSTVDNDQVKHLGAWKHLDRASTDLPAERLIRTEQQLLAGLPTRVERTRHLRTTKRARVEQAAIFAGKRHALFNE